MKGFKTALFSLALVVFGALQGFDWITLVNDPQKVGWITAAIGVIVFGLRTVTDSGIFDNKSATPST